MTNRLAGTCLWVFASPIFFVFFISDFSPKVPFICLGENFPGPFKIACEWSAYTCRKISRPVTKTPGKCPLIGESKDSFAQPCGKCPVRSEGIPVFTTLGQKENTHEEERSNRRKNGAGAPASKERDEQSEDCGIHRGFLLEGPVSVQKGRVRSYSRGRGAA